jgi:ribose/xylose/arabinose/galactoside ABC-type transport system permease subunit
LTRPRLLGRLSLRELSSSSQFLGVAVLLVGLFVAFSLTEPRFFTAPNIRVMLTSVAILWMIALGLTVVMLTGGFDLSLGSMLGLAGFVFVGFYVKLGLPALLAVLLTVAAGAVIGGAANGFLIGRVRMPFLVVTIGTLSLFQGITYLVSGGQTTSLTSPLLDSIGFGTALGVPYSVWIMLGTLVVSLFVLRRTYFGRDVYATGGNPRAAQLAGVSVTRTLIAAYAFAGAMAALGGVLQNAFISAASPVGAGTIIFDATAAVLLGGTALGGGVGGIGGTVVGVLFLGVLQNGLSLGGVQGAWQQVISGAIVILAVLFQQLQGTGTPLLPLRRRPDEAPAESVGPSTPTQKEEVQV